MSDFFNQLCLDIPLVEEDVEVAEAVDHMEVAEDTDDESQSEDDDTDEELSPSEK